MEEKTCGFYTQAEARVNGFGVWHYLIDSPIGHIHIVEWEKEGHELTRKILGADNDAAVKKYNSVCKALLKYSK